MTYVHIFTNNGFRYSATTWNTTKPILFMGNQHKSQNARRLWRPRAWNQDNCSKKTCHEQAWHIMSRVFMHEFCIHLSLRQCHVSWWYLHLMDQIAYIKIKTSHLTVREKRVRKCCPSLSTIKFKKLTWVSEDYCRQPWHPLIIVAFCRTINNKEICNLRHSAQGKKISHRTRFKRKFETQINRCILSKNLHQ